MNRFYNTIKSPIISLTTILLLTLGVYWQTLSHDFINFDDPQFVYTNPYIQHGITLETIKWALTTSYFSTWQPVTYITYMIDYSIGGLDPYIYHLSNLVYHIISIILLYLLLNKATGSSLKSLFVTSIFALHPLHVESVAWVSERRDVLAAIFWFLTTYLYLSYCENKSKKTYILVCLSLTLGLMSKPVLITLPFTLMLLDYWPLKRFDITFRDVTKSAIEKLPLFMLITFSSLLTYNLQYSEVKAVSETIPMIYKLSNAAISYTEYVTMFLAPSGLALFYPHQKLDVSIIQGLISFAFIALISMAVFRYRHNAPFLITGYFWFLGVLVPNIGIVQVGGQALADRYMHIPIIGLAIIFVWGLDMIFKKINNRDNSVARNSMLTVFLLVTLIMSMLTHSQAAFWKNDQTVFSRAVSVTENNHIAHNYLGRYYYKTNNFSTAKHHYEEAIKAKPDYNRPVINLAFLYLKQNDFKNSINYFLKALNHEKAPILYSNLAYAYKMNGQTNEAINTAKEALKMDAGYFDAHVVISQAYLDANEPSVAIEHLNIALTLNPNDQKPYYLLGYAHSLLNNHESALRNFETAVSLAPNDSVMIDNIRKIKSIYLNISE